MKLKIYLLSSLLLLFLASSAYAIPPYFGISVGKNLSFQGMSCLQIAKTVLKEDGFHKIITSKSSATLFAAYRNSAPYQYKALIKCLADEGMVVVVVVANSTRYVRTKAEKLRYKIRQYTRNPPSEVVNIQPIKAAIPPYFGISVGDNLSFEVNTCQQAAKNTLTKARFQKIMLSKAGVTFFAAYRNKPPYKYKALVRCMPDSGLIIVIVVADSLKHIKQQAYNIRRQIQQRLKTKPSKEAVEENHVEESHQDQPAETQPHHPEQNKEDNVALTSETWESTLLSESVCLKKAQTAVKKAGFHQDFSIDDRSVTGKNKDNYIGLIRCVMAEEFVFFWVKGSNKTVRQQLLSKLKHYF